MKELDLSLLILQFVVFSLALALFIYILLFAIPYQKECDLQCKEKKPFGEILIEAEVETFKNICSCKYSDSIKNIRLKL